MLGRARQRATDRRHAPAFAAGQGAMWSYASSFLGGGAEDIESNSWHLPARDTLQSNSIMATEREAASGEQRKERSEAGASLPVTLGVAGREPADVGLFDQSLANPPATATGASGRSADSSPDRARQQFIPTSFADYNASQSALGQVQYESPASVGSAPDDSWWLASTSQCILPPARVPSEQALPHEQSASSPLPQGPAHTAESDLPEPTPPLTLECEEATPTFREEGSLPDTSQSALQGGWTGKPTELNKNAKEQNARGGTVQEASQSPPQHKVAQPSGTATESAGGLIGCQPGIDATRRPVRNGALPLGLPPARLSERLRATQRGEQAARTTSGHLGNAVRGGSLPPLQFRPSSARCLLSPNSMAGASPMHLATLVDAQLDSPVQEAREEGATSSKRKKPPVGMPPATLSERLSRRSNSSAPSTPTTRHTPVRPVEDATALSSVQDQPSLMHDGSSATSPSGSRARRVLFARDLPRKETSEAETPEGDEHTRGLFACMATRNNAYIDAQLPSAFRPDGEAATEVSCPAIDVTNHRAPSRRGTNIVARCARRLIQLAQPSTTSRGSGASAGNRPSRKDGQNAGVNPPGRALHQAGSTSTMAATAPDAVTECASTMGSTSSTRRSCRKSKGGQRDRNSSRSSTKSNSSASFIMEIEIM